MVQSHLGDLWITIDLIPTQLAKEKFMSTLELLWNWGEPKKKKEERRREERG